MFLDKCVVTVDPDYDEVFELHEWGHEPSVFKVIHVQACFPGHTHTHTLYIFQIISCLDCLSVFKVLLLIVSVFKVLRPFSVQARFPGYTHTLYIPAH